jgi:hypothetical protein
VVNQRPPNKARQENNSILTMANIVTQPDDYISLSKTPVNRTRPVVLADKLTLSNAIRTCLKTEKAEPASLPAPLFMMQGVKKEVTNRPSQTNVQTFSPRPSMTNVKTTSPTMKQRTITVD